MSRRPTQPLLTSGVQIGNCRIVELIGAGGMGEVYLAEHLSLQKQVALKILPPLAAQAERIERFLREARICARIEHPNVLTIYDVGRQGDLYYIVMQFVVGQNLRELVSKQHGPLPWDVAGHLIRRAAKGLHAVHERGVIHRDVKPSNIMLASDGRVLLMDFGLVRVAWETPKTACGAIVGTPTYMSPEQCLGQPLDHRSDIFSLGSTFYYLLTARAPFPGKSRQVMLRIASREPPEPVHEVNPGVPRPVSDLVARAMAPDPSSRYPSAEQLAREIAGLIRR